MTDTSRIVVAVGAWAAERRLLAEIEHALPAGRIPSAPIVVVVPSHSLRQHLLGRLADRRPAWLGLEILTLAGLASAILRRSGPEPRSGAPLQSILVRRLAARERPLAQALGGLAGGYDEIGGAVRDLLDAGFVEEHLDAVVERLELERGVAGAGAVERAQAIARVAAGVREELAALGLAPAGDRLAIAAERVAADPATALPVGAVLVHGFADLTGVGSDLLVAVVRHRPAVAIFDAPPELDGGAGDWRFGRRLLERLRGVAAAEEEPRGTGTAEPRRAFVAADPAREARAAAGWIANAPASARFERCALVARDLDADLSGWARELERQGVPASGARGTVTPLERRAAGVVELLEKGDEAPLGVALALAGERLETECGVPVADLRLGFALLGARSLAAAALLGRPARAVELPVADAIAVDGGGRATLRARRLEPGTLAAATGLLAAVRSALAEMARPRPLGAQLATLVRLLRRAVPENERAALGDALAALGHPPFAGFQVDAEEWRHVVASAWRDGLRAPLGAGGGVALLSVTEARGRTFDRLALLGLSRDRFPRPVHPDPLFPDALRLRLRELLPDLPVKAEGHDEERYLFAQVVASAETLAIFRPLADGVGRPLPASPLLDELGRGGRLLESSAPDPPRQSALDQAIDSALRSGENELGALLSASSAEAHARFGAGDERSAVKAAEARAALLTLRSGDPARPGALRLGPYLGAVGAIGLDERGASIDPRRRTPSVTALERLAGCGWRAFLERILRLQPIPELVEALPSLPGRLAGTVVHGVLDQLLPEARGVELGAALAGPPRDCAWPDAATLERLVRTASRRELAREGLDPSLFETTLARQALALLEVARATDWPDGRRELLAVEANGEGAIVAHGVERRIPFRVDRVERRDGLLLLTDYKTGQPLSKGVREATRAKHLAAKIASGDALQLAVYLLGVAGESARARYLHLKPELDSRVRELALDAAALPAERLTAVLETLFAAWDGGAFVPRLLEPDLKSPPAACAVCEVRDACVQGDSGARLRLARWASAAPESGEPWELAARAWWSLRGAAGGTESEEAT